MDDEVARQLVAEMVAMRAELRELRAGPRSTGKTLRQIYELDEATWSRQSWAPQMRAVLKPALDYFGDREADSITRSEWTTYRDHIRANQITRRKGPPTPLTMNHEIRSWRTVYRRQLEEGNVSTNPLVGIRPVRGAKKHRETEPSIDDVFRALRPHCDAELWAFVLLAFQRGLRASEARRLEWSRVDLGAGVVLLPAAHVKTRRAYQLRITSDVVAALRAIRPDVPGRYVFQSPVTGAPYDATTLWRKWRLAADEAGLGAADGDVRVRFHDLRRGFTSRAARRHGLPVAMRLSRHRSLKSVEPYINVDDRELEAAYAEMEDEVRRGPRPVADEPAEDTNEENRQR